MLEFLITISLMALAFCAATVLVSFVAGTLLKVGRLCLTK